MAGPGTPRCRPISLSRLKADMSVPESPVQEPKADVFKLVVPRGYTLFVFGIMGVMSAVGVGLLVSAARGLSDGPPIIVVMLWCAALAWNWIVLLGIPYQIRMESADRLSFVSLARTTTLAPSEILSLKPLGMGGGFYVLRHNGGRIWLLVQFTGFHKIVSAAVRSLESR